MNIYSPMWYVEIVRENVGIQVKRVDALTGSIISAPVVQEDNADTMESESFSDQDDVVTDLQLSPEAEAGLSERKLISE